MKPVTIRYYGLFPIRKKTYLVLQTIALVLCGVWLIAGLILMIWRPLTGPLFKPVTGIGLWDWFMLLGVVVTVAEILDTVFTLRAFRRKEEEEKTRFDSGTVSAPRHADSSIKESEDRVRHRR
jgi:hypothetical protein